MHVNELNNVQKEMDKLLQQQKSTWDFSFIDINTVAANNNFNSAYAGCDNNNTSGTNTKLKSALKGGGGSGTQDGNKTSPKHKPLISTSSTGSNHSNIGNNKNQRDDMNNKSSSNTTATILVSKTKTKTGLPLMLKK